MGIAFHNVHNYYMHEYPDLSHIHEQHSIIYKNFMQICAQFIQGDEHCKGHISITIKALQNEELE